MDVPPSWGTSPCPIGIRSTLTETEKLARIKYLDSYWEHLVKQID